MLHEVGAEAPLHAGATLVRGVLLDPGRGDPHHLAVASPPGRAGIRRRSTGRPSGHGIGVPDRLRAEALAGNDVVDGAGGTDANALAAPGAAGVLGVAVAADDDLGVLAPLGRRRARPPPGCPRRRARSGCRGCRATCRAGSSRRPACSSPPRSPSGCSVAQRDLVARDVRLELVARRRVAVPLEVLHRIALEQHAEHALAVLHRGRGSPSGPPSRRPPVWRRRAAAFRCPSTETRQMRQLPTVGSFGYQQSVGTSTPCARAASRMVSPSAIGTGCPLIVSEGIVWCGPGEEGMHRVYGASGRAARALALPEAF